MRLEIRNANDEIVEILDAYPECGEAFCDRCGDCLHCDPHDVEPWCATGGWWILYEEDNAETIAKIRARLAEANL